MLRKFYSFLFYIVLPLVFLRLIWRSRRLPSYRQRLRERLGYCPFKINQSIWLHAVSVGETLAAIPLIKALKKRYPTIPLIVTTMTPTGAERVRSAFGDSVSHAYIPYDLPSAVRRFLNTICPLVAVIMETELWPNLLAICKEKNIPVCLINARLSEKSAQGYQRLGSLTREMIQNIDVIAAHGQADALRFMALGAPKNEVEVTGNIKFDLELPPDLSSQSAQLRESLGKNRFIWMAASTHENEEEIILAAHKKLREKNSQALLILSPRHPDRFEAIAKLCEQHFITKRRSHVEQHLEEAGVYLGDTMGELLLLYGACDVAFVGGSLIPKGGHNILEPGAMAKPILTGPHLFNFAEISEFFVSANALLKVIDEKSLAEELIRLMQNHEVRIKMGQRALAVMENNRGALAKQLDLVSKIIERSLGSGLTC